MKVGWRGNTRLRSFSRGKYVRGGGCLKIGDRVMTPNGSGTIKNIEFPESERITRYGVVLDVSPNRILYYFKSEVSKEEVA